MILYQAHLEQLIGHFEYIDFKYLSRDDNQFADALAKLASMINILDHLNMMPLCVDRREEPSYSNAIEEIKNIEGENPWHDHILQYITHGSYPANTSSKTKELLESQPNMD